MKKSWFNAVIDTPSQLLHILDNYNDDHVCPIKLFPIRKFPVGKD